MFVKASNIQYDQSRILDNTLVLTAAYCTLVGRLLYLVSFCLYFVYSTMEMFSTRSSDSRNQSVSVRKRAVIPHVFINKVFYREGLLAPRPTPKLEDHPSSTVRDCLFNLFAATLLIGGRSSVRILRTRHAVVTGTHYIREQ